VKCKIWKLLPLRIELNELWLKDFLFFQKTRQYSCNTLNFVESWMKFVLYMGYHPQPTLLELMQSILSHILMMFSNSILLTDCISLWLTSFSYCFEVSNSYDTWQNLESKFNQNSFKWKLSVQNLIWCNNYFFLISSTYWIWYPVEVFSALFLCLLCYVPHIFLSFLRYQIALFSLRTLCWCSTTTLWGKCTPLCHELYMKCWNSLQLVPGGSFQCTVLCVLCDVSYI